MPRPPSTGMTAPVDFVRYRLRAVLPVGSDGLHVFERHGDIQTGPYRSPSAINATAPESARPYSVSAAVHHAFTSQHETLEFLRALGFPVNPEVRPPGPQDGRAHRRSRGRRRRAPP